MFSEKRIQYNFPVTNLPHSMLGHIYVGTQINSYWPFLTQNEVMKKHLYEPDMHGNMPLIVTYSRTVSLFSSRDYKARVLALITSQ